MDIGLGNGLRNKLPEYIAKKDFFSAKKIVSSCYAILAIFLIISPSIDWLEVLNSPTSDSKEIRELTNVIFITFCIQFLLGLLNSILFAYQIPALQSLLTLVAQALSLIALIIQVFVFNTTSVSQIGLVNSIISPIVLLVEMR